MEDTKLAQQPGKKCRNDAPQQQVESVPELQRGRTGAHFLAHQNGRESERRRHAGAVEDPEARGGREHLCVPFFEAVDLVCRQRRGHTVLGMLRECLAGNK